MSDDTERLPAPGMLPEQDILVEIFQRITILSDEINDPYGLMARRFKAVEDTATARHIQQMAALKRILDEVLMVKCRLFDAEENIRTLDAHGYLNGAAHAEVQ